MQPGKHADGGHRRRSACAARFLVWLAPGCSLQARADDAGYRRHEISGQKVALLTDRVRVHLHPSQIYGTQTQIRDGKIVFAPIEDPAHLDQRRAAIGLMSMPACTCLLQTMYFPPKSAAGGAGSAGRAG